MNNDLSGIAKLLAGETIIAPRAVLFNDEIYFESKILFSEAFTIALSQIAENGRTAETVARMMKETVKSMETADIQYYCLCPETKAEAVRNEVVRLINHTNISECLKRRV